MAKKKNKRPKPKSKRSQGSRKDQEMSMPFLDPRVGEKLLSQLVGGFSGPGVNDQQIEAEDFLQEAYRAEDEDEQFHLALKALQAWPDYADAYVLLAEQARNPKDALELYHRGLAAAERVLGPKIFKEWGGQFWKLLETRPYMRARNGLALSLWALGRREEAVQNLEEMLRLNPNDNQGVRHTLAAWLLNMDRDKELGRLLKQYDEERMATWAYTRVLLELREHGDTPRARQLLEDAKRANKHVPDYLLERKSLPPQRPHYYSPGAESEAVMYVENFLSAWKSSPNAMTWLRGAIKGSNPQHSNTPKAKGSSSSSKRQLGRLTQRPDSWLADCRKFPQWISVAGEPMRPWVMLITSGTDGLILGHQLFEEEPSTAMLWDQLAKAMEHPVIGEPHRPSELLLLEHERWDELMPHLAEIGIECIRVDELDQLDLFYENLTKHLVGEPRPSMLDMPGVGPDQVGSFFAVAARFYRMAPWRSLGYESIIKVECDKFQSGPWYAVVIGQKGLTLGMTLYDDLIVLEELQNGDYSDEETARLSVALSITFGNATELTMSDFEAAQEHGWEIAGPEAHPCIFRKEKGMTIRQPLAWELELMEGCLRAVPEFISQYKPDDPTRSEATVPVASGQLSLGLSWVQEV